MSETKTYVFGNDGQCGGGMMSLLAPLLQRNGLDPNLLLAMNKNGNGWGDGSGFMWVIFLFFLMGWVARLDRALRLPPIASMSRERP